MAKPPFVMSKYVTKEDLFRDKADYYQKRCREAEVLLERLRDRCMDELADPEDVGEILSATDHLKEAFDDERLMFG